MPERQRILFLFSDTGGGHRSAMEAIIEALEHRFPDRYEAVPVDAFKEYAPPPLNKVPAAYPEMARHLRAWSLGFHAFDGPRRAKAITDATWPYIRPAVRRLVEERPADLIVSVHPLLTRPLLRALGKARPPFIVVVTDLVSAHAAWYQRQVDLCLVPTEAARWRALEFGMRPDQVQVIGLPVARRFCAPAGDRASIRAELGWPNDRPMVLLVGGGEGMGPLYDTARAIAETRGEFGLAIVTGRNHRLRRQLEEVDWEIPTFIYGFESRMPMMMQAATLLVTKAGPGTIAEALNAGLPMVLYSRVPGQEDGNVAYVVTEGVGIWAPGPGRTAAAVGEWLERPEELQKAVEVARSVARPGAADEVAGIIDEFLAGRRATGGAAP
jgi:1,2-diacylglycerol 3-beta-galactosyltransferase